MIFGSFICFMCKMNTLRHHLAQIFSIYMWQTFDPFCWSEVGSTLVLQLHHARSRINSWKASDKVAAAWRGLQSNFYSSVTPSNNKSEPCHPTWRRFGTVVNPHKHDSPAEISQRKRGKLSRKSTTSWICILPSHLLSLVFIPLPLERDTWQRRWKPLFTMKNINASLNPPKNSSCWSALREKWKHLHHWAITESPLGINEQTSEPTN